MSDTVLFITSNGAGLGHLTRAMAVARRLPSGLQPIIFTLSQGAPIVRSQGYFVEYLPSADYLEGGQARLVARMRWNTLFRERLLQLLETFEPAVVVFDGTYPYNGLLEAIKLSRGRQWVWCRRGMWRPDLGKDSIARASSFDSVIEPGEFASAADQGLTAKRRTGVRRYAPICYLDPQELLDRSDAEKALGLAPKKLNVFVQLGAGNINDITSTVGMCSSILGSHERVQLVLAESSISGSYLGNVGKAVRIRGYPLARYFNAFDVAVSASGYNTYHELIACGVPSLFIPNTQTALDDQLARARHAEAEGAGLCWEGGEASLSAKIAELLDDSRRAAISKRLEEINLQNGAADVADYLSELAGVA